MKANIIKKPNNTDEFKFQDNAENIPVDEIQRVDVLHEGGPLLTCQGCKNLEKKVNRLEKIVEDLRQEKERETALVDLGELIGKL